MRASRWPLLSVVFGALTAAALLASVVLSWTGVYAAASTVARGDAQHAMAHVQEALDELGHPVTTSELDAIREDLASDGVVFLSVSEHGELVTSGVAHDFGDAEPHPGDVDREGETWRAVGMHGPPGGPGGPHDKGLFPFGPPPFGPPPFGEAPPDPFGPPPGMHGPPQVIVELVPRTAIALEQRASFTLAVGILAALLVLATSIALRRAAAEREKSLRTGERTKHLTSLGEMSAVLAHEIRNPLASLKGHAQLLEESLEAHTREHAKAERVVREAIRIERLTTDLLAFVRSGTLAPRKSDPRAMAKAAIEAAGAGRTQLIDRGAPEQAPIDAERVRGALENLIRNAIEADPASEVEVVLGRDGDALEIRVRDHGPGIRPGDEEKIFEPFHTTRTQGTGLGLAVARRIAEAHDGSLTAANASDGGAVFTMRLSLKKGG